MPVIAKQNQLDQQLYEYQFQQAAADFAVYDTTVTNSVHQRLLLFRAHHHKCASRRRNALANEMRQESRRADWLRRKYVDSVRQQQTHQQQVTSSRLNQTTAGIATGGEATTSMTATSKGGGGLDTGMDNVQHSELADVKPFTNGTTGTLPDKAAGHPVSAENRATEMHRPATGATPVEMDTAVFIKREPDTLDYLSSASPCGDGQDMSTGAADFAAIKSDSEGHKRRLSFSLKADPSKWGSLCTLERDARDDLKLTAYDVIAGVISTPPIKPLEPEGENGTSKLKPLASLTTGTATPSTTATTTQQPTSQTTSPATTPTTSTTSCCTSLPKVSKEQHYLVHELDEFSKIMDEVTQEQTAMELAAAETVYSEHSHEPSLVSPYLSIPSSCPPREISVPNNSFYQQKYPQVQAVQKQSQVVHQDYHHHHQHHHHHHQQQQQHSASMPAECKSPLLLSGVPGRLSVLSDLPSSSSSQPVPPTTPLEHFSSSSQLVPPTPTTPLEHFTSFSSPSHSHLTSSAAHAGNSHLPTRPGIPHLPSHPSTSHLTMHPSTSHLPSHPSNSHHLLHPVNLHAPPHPSTTTHIPPHPSTTTHIPPHPGTTPHILPHPGTTPHIPPHPSTTTHIPHPGTTPHITPHPGTTPHIPPHPGTTPHITPHPGTTTRIPPRPGTTTHISPHPSTTSHIPPHPGTIPPHPGTIPPHPGTTPHIPTHPGTTSHIPPHPGTTPHITPHPGTTPHISPHQCSPQQVVCQPYPSTPPHPFPYNHPPDTNSYLSSGSASVGDSWSSAHRQQPPQVMGVCQGRVPITSASISQGSLKDSILARVSSRVVAIAGHKRPPVLDLSGVPPSKRKGGGSMLDHCGRSAGGGQPPQYSAVTHHTPSPYETSTTPLSLSSVSFPSPHQHL